MRDNESKEWKSETVFHSGDDYFEGLFEDLGKAETSIDLETYIFNDDGLGRRVCEALEGAAGRGVRVRVMVDGVGSPAWALRFVPELLQAGVEAKVYHPLPWIFWSYSLIWRRGMNGVLSFFRRINRRNHRKVVVIDRNRAWAGSMNISAVHLASLQGMKAWRDAGVCVVGRDVVHLVVAFEKAWRRARGPERGVRRGFFKIFRRDRRFSPLVRLNHTRMRRRQYLEDLIRCVDQASERVWITTPYFVPRRILLAALMRAAQRGLDVRLVVPRKPDVFFIRWVSRVFFGSLVEQGAKVFEFLPTVLHAKIAIFDEFAFVGSCNFNHRSFVHDLEVDIVVSTKTAVESLSLQFQRDLEASREMTQEMLADRSAFEKIAGKILLLFRNWL